MTTRKLYHEDPYAVEFTANILQVDSTPEGFWLLLDQTLFYPESGGQPADQGSLNGIPVLDVQERGKDIYHRLKKIPDKSVVTGLIDWHYRFDLMQQHSGQHILSQAILQTLGAETISFHLSTHSASIDINQSDPDKNLLLAAEELANEVIFQDSEISILSLNLHEAENLSWRTTPPKGLDTIRGVRIGEFDLCGCGGTHVRRTGEIGMIKVLKNGPMRDGCRIDFACGKRALTDYRIKNNQIRYLAQLLETGEHDIISLVEQLTSNQRNMEKQVKELSRTVDQYTADRMWSETPTNGRKKVVLHVYPDMSIDRLKETAVYLSEKDNTIALLGAVSPKPAVVFARSQHIEESMSELLRAVLPLFGGKGGGQPALSQGGGFDPSDADDILQEALHRLQ